MKIKPCPCCGSTDLYTGYAHAQAMGVQCRKCGLQMERQFPGRWPRGTGKLTGDEKMVIVEKQTLEKAITAWNKRVRQKTV